MITLTANRLTVSDRFSYAVTLDAKPAHLTTEDLAEVTDELVRLGVTKDTSLHYIVHARMWGSVEIDNSAR